MKEHLILKNLLIVLLLLTISLHAQSQNVKGTVVDSLAIPIPDVTVVLQTHDSAFVDAAYTDSLGVFQFRLNKEKEYRLLLNHVFYHPKKMIISTDRDNPIHVVLSEKSLILKEVSIVAEKPIMKIENNVLSYDAKHIAQTRVVSNAYETLKEIPGIIVRDETLELIGGGNPHIVINGKISTMSLAQVAILLKSMPASKVKTIEVMYNPPAKYNTKGSLINIVLDDDMETNDLVGEANTSYRQSHYGRGSLGANILYNYKKITFDFLTDISHGKNWGKRETFSRHTLQDRTVEINENEKTRSKRTDFKLRLGADYAIDKDNKLSLSYYVDGDNGQSTNRAINDYKDFTDYKINSTTSNKGTSWLHNLNLLYTTKNSWNIGTEYTSYYDPNDSHLVDYKDGLDNNNFINKSSQKIDRLSFYANTSNSLFHKINLIYGANAAYNTANSVSNYYFYQPDNSFDENEDMRQLHHQKEYIANAFIETNYKISKVVSLSASLKTEYFKTDYENNGKRGNLWNEWGFYPNTSLSFNFSSKSNLQVNFSSDKRYPSYWSINPATTYLNSYSEIIGNPELKPQKRYKSQLIYTQNKKYMVIGFVNYTPDYFTQLLHQPEDQLKTIYRYENYDYQLQIGMAFIIPFSIKEFWNAKLTLNGLRMQDRLKNFYGFSINNTKYVGIVNMSNSFTLSKNKPNVQLQLNVGYQSKAQQGIYDLGDSWSLSSALKWAISNQAHVVLQYNNILRNDMPRPIVVDFQNQYRVQKQHELSNVKIQFVWKFGNYKTPKHQTIDQSRLGR